MKKDESIKPIPFFMYSSKQIDKDNRELAIDIGVDRCIMATEPEEIKNEALAYIMK